MKMRSLNPINVYQVTMMTCFLLARKSVLLSYPDGRSVANLDDGDDGRCAVLFEGVLDTSFCCLRCVAVAPIFRKYGIADFQLGNSIHLLDKESAPSQKYIVCFSYYRQGATLVVVVSPFLFVEPLTAQGGRMLAFRDPILMSPRMFKERKHEGRIPGLQQTKVESRG